MTTQTTTPDVPDKARALAAQLAQRFTHDSELTEQLNAAHHRLEEANDRLVIHVAFCEYQLVSERRRQLAVEVGELGQQLTDTLCAAGWSPDAARRADVDQLATAGGGAVR